MEIPVGKVLGGRYRVTGTLGSGGMAVVYKAEDAILGRGVALKTLREDYAEEPEFRRRFKQEARAMASLDHPKIVRVYDISQEDGVPFIVAECVEGEDAGDKLARVGRMELGEALDIAEQLLEALSYAHERGIIHRDIKPSNVMLTGDSIKVADFGIARMVEEDRDDNGSEDSGSPEDSGSGGGEPGAGQVIGSARYMSPEQILGRKVTPRSDLYSVGILLYHCLTGEPPFSGDARSVTRQQLHREPLSPRRLNRKISQGLDLVILEALSKDPSWRYPSAEAMLEALRRESRRAGFARGTAPAMLGRFFGERKKSLATATLVLFLLSGLTAAGISGNTGERGDLISSRAPEEGPSSPGQTQRTGGSSESSENSENGETRGISGLSGLSGSDDPGETTGSGDADENTASKAGETSGGGEETSGGETSGGETSGNGTTGEADYALVPDVDAYYDYYAEDVLENRGFETEVVYDYHEGYNNRGVTWGTNPLPGVRAPEGSTVTIYATPKDQTQPQP